jgi:hypothetical protein
MISEIAKWGGACDAASLQMKAFASMMRNQLLVPFHLGCKRWNGLLRGRSIERTAAPSRPHQLRVDAKKPWSPCSPVFKVGTTERMKP